jgi:hypothetical protein
MTMVVVPGVAELRLFGAFDRGVPNRERITLRVQGQAVNLGNYFLLLGSQRQPYSAMPIPNQSFWLGEMVLEPWTWLYVFTGPGSPGFTTQQETGETAYVMHWGRKGIVLREEHIVPVIMRMQVAGITVGQWTPDIPQLYEHLGMSLG